MTEAIRCVNIFCAAMNKFKVQRLEQTQLDESCSYGLQSIWVFHLEEIQGCQFLEPSVDWMVEKRLEVDLSCSQKHVFYLFVIVSQWTCN